MKKLKILPYAQRYAVSDTYAPATRCFPLRSPHKTMMKNWLVGKKLYLGETNIGNRYFILTTHEGHPRFMDIITGSMYETKGRCLSSAYLHIDKIKRITPDTDELIKELRKVTG